MLNVFLSHTSADKPFVRLFGEDLKAAGLSVWLDEAKLKIGDSLPSEISKAIDGSDFFLVFLSEHSLKSNWVKKEVAIATTKEINGESVRVLPLRLDGSKVPALLVDKIYANFARTSEYNSEFLKVLKAIDSKILPKTSYSFHCLSIGRTRKDRLVLATESIEMQRWVQDYLLTTLEKCKRSSERYWIYIALGEIGGETAEAAIRRGLADPESLSRSGAEAALKLIRV